MKLNCTRPVDPFAPTQITIMILQIIEDGPVQPFAQVYTKMILQIIQDKAQFHQSCAMTKITIMILQIIHRGTADDGKATFGSHIIHILFQLFRVCD